MAKKDKKSKNSYEDDDMYETQEAEEFGSPAPESPAPEESEPSGPQEAEAGNVADEFADGGLMSALKRSRKKKTEKADAETAAAEKAAADSVVVVKSKKEKEKEKKEREKARKRAESERKKTAPPVEKKTKDSSASVSPAPEDKPSAASKPAATKKKTGKSAIAAVLQKQIAARKAAEDAARAQEEEAQREIEEEERRLAEEERALEEARQKKKEKERLKKEELRAQGKLLTKKQKEQQALVERRRQQLLASGVQVEALMGDSASDKSKRPVYGKKKASKKQQSEEPEPAKVETVEVKETVAEPEPVTEAVKVAEVPAAEEEEVLIDDWEAALDSDGEVKDNWDDEADSGTTPEPEVESKPEPKEVAKTTPVSDNKHGKEKDVATKDSAADAAVPEEESALEKAMQTVSKKKTEISEKREERMNKAMASASSQNLRSPICCILGHVDTGKTKLLDKVRQTNVQEGEAGGITQQIGATYFPIDAIQQKTKVMDKFVNINYNVPGLLVIDTPGHESFTNLRTRGSSLCNIAILVVDIMHGLEPQTLESIRLLRDRKTPFVVALNKIDRLYDWETIPNNSFRDSFSKQKSSVQREFQDRLEKTKVAFAEQGLNAELYFQNKNLARTVSLVPTSAITGEGVPDLLYLLLELTQSRMSKQLMYLSHLEATVLEVKVIEGLGTTIDVILSNGVLKEGDRIVLCGQNGPIATNVRALLTPQPMRELRIKSAYVHNKEVKAALGVKIAANDLDKAVAGSRLLLVGPDDDEDDLMDDVMDDLTGLLDSVDKSGKGVCVQASTLGSLEALLDFLKSMKIPVMAISIGPVFKRDVMRATTMLEKAPELAIMMCFDVKIDKEAEQYAEEQGVKIFSANIIYHLFDAFTEYQQKLLEKRKKEHMHEAVWPCVLKTLQIINKRNPMIIGVDVIEGGLRVGTPIAVVKEEGGVKEVLPLGRVVSLEVNHKTVDSVRKGQTNAGVAMRLEAGSSMQPTWGRHVDEKDLLYSMLSRKSIDILKDPAFRNDVIREDWVLIKNLKPKFDIK